MSSPIFSRRPLAALGLTGLAAAAAFTRSAEAQTVDDVLSKKKVQVGILVDLPPFGVVNAKNEYEGYDVDVARLMAKYLGVECELVPVTGPNRIPYLLTGKVDVLVATFGITPERARQVQFCIPYSSIDIVLMAPAERKIATAADLATLKVGVARASTQDTAISGVVPQGTRIMRFDDDATTAQALLSNQIDAIGVNTITAQQIQTMNRRRNTKRSSCCGTSRTASRCAAARPICSSGSTPSSTSSRTTASSTRSTASG